MGWRRAVPAALTLSLLLSGLPLGAAAAEVPAPTVAVAQDANLGTILTGPNGMTLYMFTKDAPGVSNCYDQCAVNWPPLLLPQGSQPVAPAGLKGSLGTTTRKDGTVQATYNGWPLYYWVKDKAPGDTTGQNVNGIWFVLNPDGPLVKLAQDTTLGTILTGANGMTLYVFTKDAPGVTNCYGQCAVNWPPLLLKDGELLNAPAGLGGKLATLTRTDGTQQVTLNGAPLYYWVKDKAPGQTTGHKVQGVWFVGAPGLLLDVAGTWAQPQVSAAVRAGWARAGADGKFHMNDQVARAEFVTMVTAAFKLSGMALPDGWAAGAQAEPDRALTRAEAAGLLVQALGLQAQAAPAGVGRFTDMAGLSAEAAGLVGVAVDRGIVQGYPDNTFQGGKVVTRAEAVTLIARALTVKK